MVGLLLGACAVTPPPQPGTARAEVLRTWGQPSAHHALPGGVDRLEYATGPYGRTTWMIDIDAGGRVVQARQVLGEAEFEAVMGTPGLRRAGVLRRLGAPGEKRRMGWLGGEIWSWRYPTNDCLRFEISLALDGRVTGSGYGIDPACDRRHDPK
ncbi:MAG: hypothetical protein C0505_16980 [Leptothrix sp. (in: Bacteria)]|nr:hypothetical protein [Leptothrix sp. (in: b-proteobacteria)]